METNTMSARRCWGAVLCALAMLPGAQAQGQPAADAETRTRFDYRIEPFVDVYNYVREQATRRGAADASSEFSAAVEAAKRLHEKLNQVSRRPLGILAWEPLDQLLLESRSAAEFSRVLEKRLKEASDTDALAQVRDEAIAFADALGGVEERFRKDVWPQHAGTIRETMKGIEAVFQPKEAACIAYMLESLAIADPHDVVPVYLVHGAAWPGAFTFDRLGGGGMCTLAVTAENLSGTLLYETILHEATHALDISAGRGGGVLTEIREKLEARGLTRRDPKYRDIPHTIMFIQAGETIRRKVDPAHKHYGEANTYYERSGRVAEVERRVWIEYLDGKLARGAAVDRIVEELIDEDGSP